MAVITIERLIKNYEVSRRSEGVIGSLKGLLSREKIQVEAVRDISFSIEPGELVAFLGPNGAGKTTTLKILSGLLYPTSGTVRVFDQIPFEKNPEFLRRFSFVMGQRHQLWWELPAMDTFRLNAAVFDLDKTRFRNKLDELDEFLGLDPLWHTPVKKLSLGQRMKMELACSLLHDPELLLLDEPTLGLDVVMQKTLRDFIARINKEKKTTVLLTSHNMEDIETLCKRAIVIHHGKILFDGALADLVGRFVPAKTVKAVLSEPVDRLRLEQFAELESLEENQCRWSVPRASVAATVGKILNELPVTDLAVEELPLEDVIREIFSKGLIINKTIS